MRASSLHASRTSFRNYAQTQRSKRLCRVRVAAPDVPQVQASGEQAKKVLSIYYRTGWKQAFLHGSLAGAPWQDFPMNKAPTSHGNWMYTTVDVPEATNGKSPLFEFVATDNANHWDKSHDGRNFTISQPGTYSIHNGRLTPVSGKRVMVVSDLDGTMIGNDKTTAQFKQWWEDVGCLRGGVLVYNTGRALDSFCALLKEKAPCMSRPDALISAVGTKVYEYENGRWTEDSTWSSQLDLDWHLESVREACDKAIGQVSSDKMHYRPAEEQNNHKVTCGVEVSVLPQVLDSVKAGLSHKGVRANVITSGHGQWRYLDIVPIRAGKLAALNHVRQCYGFATDETVACGDSGNDILMLEGENPAIIVGNAQQDLKDWYQSRLASEKPGSGPDGKNRLHYSKQHEAAGILEGLEYWGFK